MSSSNLYLRPNVFAEPLVNSWYAWPLLIAPAPAAMVTTNLHLRLLESFVAAPDVHIAASKNPAMRGGPFISYSGDPARIVALIDRTKRELREMIDFATALRDVDKLLAERASGQSIEPLYRELPGSLRGLVELGYDLNDRASLRLIEPLAYRSKLYRPDLQSVDLRATSSDEDRAFVLSTPRIADVRTPRLHAPFASSELDALFASRHAGLSREALQAIAEKYLDSDQERSAFFELFTSTAPALPTDREYDGDGVRVRYFGHATLLVQSRDVSIMTDPIVPYAVPNGQQRYSYADLPERIDFVLLTHAHQDHVVLETMLQLRHKVGCWVVPRGGGGLQDPSLKWMLKTIGFKNVIELDELESIELPAGRITGVPFLGEHGDLMPIGKLAYHIRIGSTALLALADCNTLDEDLYRNVHRQLGDVQSIFIGMECAGAPMSWLYGPLFTRRIDRNKDQSRRLNGSNCARAAALVRTFKAPRAFVYAMGQEPWLKFISSIEYLPDSMPIQESDKFVRECASSGVAAQRLYGRREFVFAA